MGLACYSNRSLEQFKPLRSVSVGDYVASFFYFFAKAIVCFLGVSDALQIPPAVHSALLSTNFGHWAGHGGRVEGVTIVGEW